MHVISINQI